MYLRKAANCCVNFTNNPLLYNQQSGFLISALRFLKPGFKLSVFSQFQLVHTEKKSTPDRISNQNIMSLYVGLNNKTVF